MFQDHVPCVTFSDLIHHNADNYVLVSELEGTFETLVKSVPQVVDNEIKARYID